MALNKHQLRREIERDRRSKVKARIAELKELIKLARVARDEAIQSVRTDCALKRQELRQSCQLRGARAKLRGNEEVSKRAGSLTDERRYEKQIREGDKPSRLRSTRSSSRERGQESDDEVRSNISAELVPVFNAVRRHIKGSARKSRTEAFLQWVEENTDEVFGLMQHNADRELAQLLAEEERAHRELKRARGGRLAEVPF